ncbi:sensor histidine kinase [Paraflavitalea pollutisoli]|uniref:sensor histidine kinase n=1 Tax=Paraflavitalea pollutisoli TaxID=3034143 RepID=UPI0023EB6C49|nr:ATP-binding protein [Paraflavitalea sp. H1-2-19X]
MSNFLPGMKGRLRFIFLMAALTAIGIILCQLYWVYYNYRTARANFIQTATLSLRQSIDSSLVGQDTLPASLSGDKPALTFLMKQMVASTPGAGDSAQKPSFTIKLVTVDINEDQLPGVRSLVARLFSQRANKPFNLDTLHRFFRQELLRNGIAEAFTLSIDPQQQQVLPGEIAAVISYQQKPAVVRAQLTNKMAFLFRMNVAPALVSTLLILLSAGSLFYMSRIIKRQVQLDVMKNDFVNNVIHELRTPLTILRSSNEALAGFGAAHDEASLMRYLGINTLVIDDLDKNIERILDFSRIEQGRRLPVWESIDLLPVLQQTQLRYAPVNGATITITASEAPFEVLTDRFMFGVIVSNLVDNAIKYSPEAAVVAIDVRRVGAGWQLQVRDQGMGIPRASLPYIFDKFYRVPTGDLHDSKGYGIGLAYVKRLVTDLKGTIAVTSEVGKGTVFTLTFTA